MSLFEDVVFFLGRKRAVAQLRDESSGGDDEAVRVGVVLSLPVVIANLRRWLTVDEQALWFGDIVAGVPADLASDVDALLANDDMTELSNDVLDLLLGEDAPRIVTRLAHRAQIREESAARLMSITTSALLAHLSARHRTAPSPATLRGDFAVEARELDAGGWQPWVEETLAEPNALVGLEEWKHERSLYDVERDGPQPVSDDASGPDPFQTAVGEGHLGGGIGSLATETGRSEVARSRPASVGVSTGSYPPPDQTTRLARPTARDVEPRVRTGPAGNGRPPQDPRLERPGPRGDGATGPPSTPSSALGPPSPMAWDEREGPLSGRWALVFLGAAAVVLALIAFVFLRGDDPATDVAAEDVATPTTNASGDESANTGATVTPTTGSLTDAPEGPRSLVVPLIDPLNITEGTGVATLDFDPDTGEICYEFTVDGIASPYDGHIHVGPVGVKGGIVVDFGLLNGATSGCIANSPAGTAAILADLGGHYAEFHDADGVATVRAQLAEAAAGVTPEEAAAENPDGAFARIEPGKLVLTGEVPDQVTIDKYLETFADLDPNSIEIVNELVIVPGAPRPSGRIVVDDTVFFEFDSAELTDPETSVLVDLATLFKARPAWRMTVVGHTDSLGTDVYNLELSLQRANAVRSALVEAGVSPDALTVEGAGSTAPIAPNDTEEGRSQNRRIEVEVVPG